MCKKQNILGSFSSPILITMDEIEKCGTCYYVVRINSLQISNQDAHLVMRPCKLMLVSPLFLFNSTDSISELWPFSMQYLLIFVIQKHITTIGM